MILDNNVIKIIMPILKHKGYYVLKFLNDINKANHFHDFSPCNLDSISIRKYWKKYTFLWKQGFFYITLKLRFYTQLKE